MVIPLKVGFSPELLVRPLNPIGGSLQSRGARDERGQQPSDSVGFGSIFRGVDGVGARCGNGLFSTYKSPKFLS